MMRKTTQTPTGPLSLKIEGGRKLHGTVETNTSKNGAVALLAASLLNKNRTILRGMPKIEEVFRLIEVLLSIGVKITWHDHDLYIKPPKHLHLKKIDTIAAMKTRSIIMFIGPLIHLFDTFSLPQSGGCKLGERTIRPHLWALKELGVKIKVTEKAFQINSRQLKSATIILEESSDTATINAILASARIPGNTLIKYASANYQVQEVCFFLEKLGIAVHGIGTTTLLIEGKQDIGEALDYSVSEDPTDTMFFIAAALVTKSKLTIKRAPIEFLELELFTLKIMRARFKVSPPYPSNNGRTQLVDITISPSSLIAPPEKIHPRPYPGLNMDNLPFFAVIATAARGQTFIHDWVYEKRAIYYTELDRLGANTVLADPHRFFVTGPTNLHAAEMICPPALRPATIILIAMLSAKGTSILRNVYSINRGYEDLANRLNKLGANIKVLS